VKAQPDSPLALLVEAAQAGKPVLRVTLPPRWARFLIAAGARPAAQSDMMAVKHQDETGFGEPSEAADNLSTPNESEHKADPIASKEAFGRATSTEPKPNARSRIGESRLPRWEVAGALLAAVSAIAVPIAIFITTKNAIALTVAGGIIGLFLGWILTTTFAVAAISRSQERMQTKVRYWQAETARARQDADRLARLLAFEEQDGKEQNS
jgi:hypothetical protein